MNEGQQAIAGHPVAATVRTPGASYPIIVSAGALHSLGAICREVGLRGRAFLVTDEDVVVPYGQAASESLVAAGYACEVFAIQPGEAEKTLGTVETLYDWLIAGKVERRDFLVCVGGGVVTDLAGFTAATVLRGIDFVHVPTSMLAMTDAAIGGKTGVDHRLGKNLIGAFAQPRAVVIDPTVIETLPERQRRNGWAEVIKHGLILDIELVAELEAKAGQAGAMMDSALITKSVAIKAAVVSEDEKEAGRRTLLNYGHTVGHAIEAVTGYGEYLHGEAVAIGMRAAGMMSVELGLLRPEELERQQRMIRAYGLPETAPGVDVERIIAATLQDKKVTAGAVQWVLLAGIGGAVVHGAIDPEIVRRAVEAVVASGPG